MRGAVRSRTARCGEVAIRGEVIDGQTFVGTAIVLGGVGLVNSRYGRRRIFGRTAAEVPPVTGA